MKKIKKLHNMSYTYEGFVNMKKETGYEFAIHNKVIPVFRLQSQKRQSYHSLGRGKIIQSNPSAESLVGSSQFRFGSVSQ